jgi:hypothetical protein
MFVLNAPPVNHADEGFAEAEFDHISLSPRPPTRAAQMTAVRARI